MPLHELLPAAALAGWLAAAPATARPDTLPVFLADNHAETFGWATRTLDLDQPHTLVLVDAHSDASAAERSDEIREQLRRVASTAQREQRVETWRRTGRIQAFNWLEPLMPRPVANVRWVAAAELPERDRAARTAAAAAALDGRLEFEPRACGSLAARWEVGDRAGLAGWSPGAGRVVLAIDLDAFAGMADAATRFDQLWETATGWPGLDGVAIAISRPWLGGDAEADALARMALDAARRTRGARIEWDVSLDDRPDDSLEARTRRAAAGATPPRWDLARAAPPLRALAALHAGRWRIHDRARRCDAGLWGAWPAARLAADGLEPDCDGAWRFPAGSPPVLRLAPADPAAATGRVRWFARRPARTACDLLPETGLGKGFSNRPARWIYEKRSSLGGAADLALAPAAWAGLLDRRHGCGRVVIEAEYETPSGWLPAGPIDLRGVAGGGFRGGLSECFGMPYVFGIAFAEDAAGRRGVDTGWGADCSNFLAHAWRRGGTRIEWGDPARIRGQLATLAQGLTQSCRLPVAPDAAARGVAIDFGRHMAGWWEDREPRGVLDGGDLVAHHLGGVPEVLPLAELARGRPPFAVLAPRDCATCRLALLGDVVLAGAAAPDLAPLRAAADADLTLANLEGIPAAGAPGRPGARFDFRFPPARLAALRAAGVDVVSLANNHAADAGAAAIPAGRAAVQQAGLGAVGAGADLRAALAPWRGTAGAVPVSVFGACAVAAPAAGVSSPGVLALPDHAGPLAAAIAAERAAGRAVVVIVHWGTEHDRRVTAAQRRWARRFANCGAAIVAGAGPHVVQRTDRHAGAAIACSLGNAVYPPALARAGSGARWHVTLDAAGAVRAQALRDLP